MQVYIVDFQPITYIRRTAAFQVSFCCNSMGAKVRKNKYKRMVLRANQLINRKIIRNWTYCL